MVKRSLLQTYADDAARVCTARTLGFIFLTAQRLPKTFETLLDAPIITCGQKHLKARPKRGDGIFEPLVNGAAAVQLAGPRQRAVGRTHAAADFALEAGVAGLDGLVEMRNFRPCAREKHLDGGTGGANGGVDGFAAGGEGLGYRRRRRHGGAEAGRGGGGGGGGGDQKCSEDERELHDEL